MYIGDKPTRWGEKVEIHNRLVRGLELVALEQDTEQTAVHSL